jgi:hypothetical protein
VALALHPGTLSETSKLHDHFFGGTSAYKVEVTGTDGKVRDKGTAACRA